MRRVAAVLLALAACGGPGPHTIDVLAAASLTDAFRAVGREFEASEPGVRVRFSFASSSSLANQIADGARAGAFASADRRWTERVVASGEAAGEPVVFARNRLAIAVERGNPLSIRSPADLAGPGVTLVLCASHVPCGRLADELAVRAGVTLRPSSREDNVRAVLSKVTLGEADAGIVYVTDANAGVTIVDISPEVNPQTAYEIVALRSAADAARAAEFVAFVASERGRAILAQFGFDPP